MTHYYSILFSHRYNKLNGIKTDSCVNLIDVLYIPNINQLSKNFIDYDTSYCDENGKVLFWNLKFGIPYLLLFFEDENGLLFTTLRPWTEGKERFYRRSIGRNFTVLFKCL